MANFSKPIPSNDRPLPDEVYPITPANVSTETLAITVKAYVNYLSKRRESIHDNYDAKEAAKTEQGILFCERTIVYHLMLLDESDPIVKAQLALLDLSRQAQADVYPVPDMLKTARQRRGQRGRRRLAETPPPPDSLTTAQAPSRQSLPASGTPESFAAVFGQGGLFDAADLADQDET